MARSTVRRKTKQIPRAKSPSSKTEAEDQAPEGNSVWLTILPLIACICAVLWFFRDFFQFGFDRVAGDIGDNRFIIAILEHWRHVFLGQIADFTSPIFFYPEKGVLGSSEALFLFAIPYTIARAIGADMPLSFQLTLIALKVIGFWGMFLLARHVLNAGTVLATFAAVLFSISNMYFMSVGHAQLSAVVFFPWIALFGGVHWCKQAQGRTLLCRVCISSAGILTALVLFTSFYIGWFLILLASALAVVSLLVFVLRERSFDPVFRLIRTANRRKLDLFLGVLAFAIAIVPFLMTYLPMMRRTGGRNFDEVTMYMALRIDLYNVGPLNVVWSRLLNPYFQFLSIIRPSHLEMAVGWPPAITVVFAVLILVTGWRICRPRGPVKPALVFAAAAAITCTCLWLWTLLYNDFAPWWYIFKFVPGATAIRVPARFNLVLNALGIVAIVIGMAHIGRKKRPGWIKTAVGCVLAFLLVEQVNVQRLHLISRKNEATVLSRAPAPPSQCKSFYVVNVAYPGRPFYATQIDAMLISQQYNLPTVNGYSGWFPTDWKLLTFDKDYVENVNNWARRKGIASGLCSLDLASGAWSPPKSGL